MISEIEPLLKEGKGSMLLPQQFNWRSAGQSETTA